MATIKQALKCLAAETEAITAADLATRLKISPEEARAHLSRLKSRGYAQREGTGWTATEEGREKDAEGADIPFTPQDVGGDARSKLEYYGHLSGVKEDKIRAALELIMSADSYNMEWVQECFARVDVPIESRKVWLNLWANHVAKNAPAEQRERAMVVATELAPTAHRTARESGLDYMVPDDEPVFVGKGMGTLTRDEAVALSLARAARRSAGNHQGLTASDVLSIVDKIAEARKTTPAKSILVTTTAEGTRVEDLPEGMPIVVPPPQAGGHEPPKTLYVNEAGELQELPPGHPIIIKQLAPAAPPSKIMVVDNTTGELSELKPGQPLIVRQERQNTMMGPFRDKDGNPIYIDPQALEPIITFETWKNDQRRKEESHQAWVGALGALRENLPKVTSVVDRMMRQSAGAGGQPQEAQGSPPQTTGLPPGLIEVACAGCGAKVRVPLGTEQFHCKNCDTICGVGE